MLKRKCTEKNVFFFSLGLVSAYFCSPEFVIVLVSVIIIVLSIILIKTNKC